MYNQHQPPGKVPLPTTTRPGNAGAAFATSMLSHQAENALGATKTTKAVARPGQYVQFEPPFIQSKTQPAANAQPQKPPRLSQKDLLGDFSKDFQKLTVNSPSKTTTITAGNNNNTIVNNNKTTESNGDTTRDLSDNKWATFD